MSTEFPASVDVDYADGEGEGPADYPSLQHKIEKAIEVTKTGLEEYENPAVMWTGGKDSVPHKASSASCFCGLSSVSKRLY